MRLFVAIPLPEDLSEDLGRICAGVPGAKWVSPENLHITLRFIGEVDGATFQDIAAALGGVAGDRFELRLDGVGQFGDRRRVRTLWAGLEPSEPLKQLQGRIETALQGSGLEPERRKFHAHVTLARLKNAPLDRAARYLADHSAYRSRSFSVDGFVLFQSHLGSAGAIYRPEVEYFLRQSEPDVATL